MAVVARPARARARVTYMDGEPELRLSGINPALTAVQFGVFANAIQTIQTSTVDNGFLIAEHDLEED